MPILAVDHIQISIPRGRVEEVLPFYIDVLGLQRVSKPAELGNEGAWLEQGGVRIHLAEESPFATDGCAHPALLVDELEMILARARNSGHALRRDEGPNGYLRASVFDSFGNHIELMQKISPEVTPK